ncbi:S8 family serine peptidase [Pseudohaliea sp.]|uniref:S8 family serine peptidase n=1 Tax=Pseudohaliea sp. TaxID=2740289 RepID=UPI0032EB4EC0
MTLRRLAITALAALLPLGAAAEPTATEKTVIEKKDDLPRHSYRVDLPVTDLYAPENRDALLALAAAVREDVAGDLERFAIRDDSTVQDYYGMLGSVAIAEGDWARYLETVEKRQALESKDANRLTLGLAGRAVARAALAGDPTPAAVAEQLAALVDPLPYATVEANLESLKGRTEILSRALVLGSLESNYQPVLDRTGGEVSLDIAASLVGAVFSLDYFIPSAEAMNGVLAATIAANRVEKADIWAQRQVALGDKVDGTPVTLAVWDSGLDTAIFAETGQLWENPDEVPGNGRDDDDNGHIDDRHGIAYDLDANRVTELLYPIGEIAEDEASLQRLVKGLGDIQFNVDSEAASAVRQRMAALDQAEVKDFLESLGAYGNYSHGTHVGGIAAAGNPFARLLAARMTYGHELIPEEPTLPQAHREAAMMLETVQYFRDNGVRVVNMSWGGSLRGIEDALEANGAGDSPEARKALARELFDITNDALRRAITDAPEILFVTSAGNSDNDVRFDEFYPSSYDYPNLLTVGAVDKAGDETSFTSLGKVDIYGNGFEVESYVPGGNRIAYNGTSMSSPQVMNLAGKLLALYPQLTVAELKALILDAADEKALDSRTIRLLNPKASLALAEERFGG